MKDRIYWIRFSNKFLIMSGVLAIICAIVVRLLTPTSLQRQALNTRQHSEYRQAMSQYHARSGDSTNSTLFLGCPGTATNGNPHSFPMHTGTVWVEALKGGSATFTARLQGSGTASKGNTSKDWSVEGAQWVK